MTSIEIKNTTIYTVESINYNEQEKKIAKIEAPDSKFFTIFLDYCIYPKNLKSNQKINITFIFDKNYYAIITILEEKTIKSQNNIISLKNKLFSNESTTTEQ